MGTCWRKPALVSVRLSRGIRAPRTFLRPKMKSVRQMLRALAANEPDEEREYRERLRRQRREQLRRELQRGGLWGDLWNLAAVFAVFLLVFIVVGVFYLLLLAFEF